jgi:quinolinate synthase
VIKKVDMAGGTEGMIKYINKTDATDIMLVTECGLSDRMKVEYPSKRIVGSCALCPYMKKVMLKDILQVLKQPRKDQTIDLPKDIMTRAKKALDRMMKISESMPKFK